MHSDVIAIGGYKPELAEFLDYPAEEYKSVPTGCPVITTVFSCNTHHQSEELAEVLGIKEGIETHVVLTKNVDRKALSDYCERYNVLDTDLYGLEDFECFCALADANFIFICRPAGAW